MRRHQKIRDELGGTVEELRANVKLPASWPTIEKFLREGARKRRVDVRLPKSIAEFSRLFPAFIRGKGSRSSTIEEHLPPAEGAAAVEEEAQGEAERIPTSTATRTPSWNGIVTRRRTSIP